MSILNKRLGEIISIKRRPVNSVHDKPRKKQDKNNQNHKQQNVERIKGNRSAQRSNSNKIHHLHHQTKNKHINEEHNAHPICNIGYCLATRPTNYGGITDKRRSIYNKPRILFGMRQLQIVSNKLNNIVWRIHCNVEKNQHCNGYGNDHT